MKDFLRYFKTRLLIESRQNIFNKLFTKEEKDALIICCGYANLKSLEYLRDRKGCCEIADRLVPSCKSPRVNRGFKYLLSSDQERERLIDFTQDYIVPFSERAGFFYLMGKCLFRDKLRLF